jgi:hypothetical protein
VTGAITVTNGTGSNPDSLDLIYASGGVLTYLSAAWDGSSTTLNVSDTSKLSAGDYVMVSDYTQGVVAKIQTVVSTTQLTLATKCSSLTAVAYAKGALVVRAQHATFSIDKTTYTDSYGAIPTLVMDPDGPTAGAGGTLTPEPLAEYIEDMQIAVGVELNGTAGLQEVGTAANDDDWVYNKSGDNTVLTTYTPRAIRITLVARTPALFGNQTSAQLFQLPAVEDRAVGSYDSYRRRVLTTTIELRNTSGSK